MYHERKRTDMKVHTFITDMRAILYYLQIGNSEVGLASNNFTPRALAALVSDGLIEVRGRDEKERIHLTPKGRAVDVRGPGGRAPIIWAEG